jgi:predicted nuclease of predicted toxin-antitoxin system
MRFLVDDQLPPALARWFVAQGHDAFHVKDFSLTGATDRNVWERARRDGAVVVTKDNDFLNLQRQVPGPAIVWITMGNCSKAELLKRMAKGLEEIIAALEAGELVVELR